MLIDLNANVNSCEFDKVSVRGKNINFRGTSSVRSL